MQKILFSIFLISFALNTFGQSPLQKFNKVLGEKHTLAFDSAVTSFNKFLCLNYPEPTTLQARIVLFLEDIQTFSDTISQKFQFPDDIHNVLQLWENSGLRIEIFLKPDENYQFPDIKRLGNQDSAHNYHNNTEIFVETMVIENWDNQSFMDSIDTDDLFYSNTYGKFLIAIEECCSNDSLINNYILVKKEVGEISTSITANSYAKLGERLEDPILIRIIVAEFYFFLIKSKNKSPEN